jgi:mannitol-1-/sugar-/sorbitol-6-phosphatase
MARRAWRTGGTRASDALYENMAPIPEKRTNSPDMQTGAILFDMDGVLVDSRAAIERVRRRWAVRRGLDEDAVVRLPHGQKTRDIVAAMAPHLDVAEEVAWLDADEEGDLEGIGPIRGAAHLLGELAAGEWAVVTSSGRELATRRLTAARLPLPVTMISGDMVTQGKPAPEGYLLAAQRLGRQPDACVVVEDAPAGIEAGRAAGMRVIGVATTYPGQQLAGCVGVVTDLSAIDVRRDGPRITLVLQPHD